MDKMVGFRAPETLLREFRETLKKENKKGSQQKALEEAMKLWIATKKNEVVLCAEEEVGVLTPVKDINSDYIAEKGEFTVFPLSKKFPKKVFLYLASSLVESARNNGKEVACQIIAPDSSVKPVNCGPDEAFKNIKECWNLNIAGQIASVKFDNGEVALGRDFFDKIPASLFI